MLIFVDSYKVGQRRYTVIYSIPVNLLLAHLVFEDKMMPHVYRNMVLMVLDYLESEKLFSVLLF